MSHFPDVKKGDAFVPSASLENKVRHFFNGSATLSSGQNSFAYANNNRLTVFNHTDKLIPAYTPVYISKQQVNDGELWCGVSVATSDDQNWGVVTADLAANGGMGTMVISGTAQVYISGNGQFASPGSDGKLVAADSGKAFILHPGDSQTPGIVQLGYSAGAQTESTYTGQFKIIQTGENAYAVIDGTSPSSEYAGVTDLFSYRSNSIYKPVPVFHFTADSRTDVYLHACAFRNGTSVTYEPVLSFQSTLAGSFSAILVGSIRANGTIYQSLRTYDGVFYRKEWYL